MLTCLKIRKYLFGMYSNIEKLLKIVTNITKFYFPYVICLSDSIKNENENFAIFVNKFVHCAIF